MDSSIFDVTDGGSSDFEPAAVGTASLQINDCTDAQQKSKAKGVTKKAPVSKVPAAKKTAQPKPKATTKPQSIVPKKRSKKDVENEDPEPEAGSASTKG